MSTRTPILWYRSFYDVPRLFCVRSRAGYVVFECAFDDQLDEYPDRYAVKLVSTQAELSDGQTIEAAEAVAPVTEVAVDQIVFDETRRTWAEIPSLSDIDLAPDSEHDRVT